MNLFQKLKTLFTHTAEGDCTRKDFSEIYEDTGRFGYENDGFVFQFKDSPQKVFWSEAECMTAYKADLVTVDQLRMDIDFRGLTLGISEDTPGFFQFVLKTKDVFPTMQRIGI